MDTNTNANEDKFQKVYDGLNPGQKEAVDTIDGPVMVVAGPGTGKTQTISLRIANILKQTQLDPENILCLTFTESAVNTMRRRLLEIVGAPAYHIKIHTFHGFCNEVIQTHLEKFPEFGSLGQPLTDIEKFKMFSGLIDQLPYDSVLKPFGNTESYIRELPAMISGFKRDDISIEEIETNVMRNVEFAQKTSAIFKEFKKLHYRKLTETTFSTLINDLQAQGFGDFVFVQYLITMIGGYSGGKYSELRNMIYEAFEDGFKESITRKQQEFITLFKKYQANMQAEGRYDYDDMIQSVVKIFKSDKTLLSEYQERYQYILVDEFQDTNSSQNEVIKLLGSFWSDPNIFVVGDDDQSIFRFQGASVENMKNFFDSYMAKIKVISLTENYRSQQLVLDAARSVISNNGLQIHEMLPNVSKNLHAYHQEYPQNKIRILEYKDPEQEANSIAEKIAQLLTQGIIGKEIAVIFRDNNDAEDITAALKTKNIQFRLERGEDILDNPQIRQLINVLRYLVDPEKAVSLFEMFNYKFFNFDKIDLVKLFRYANAEKLDYMSVITDSAKLGAAGVANPQAFFDFGQKLASWRQDLFNYQALTFFNRIIRETGFLESILGLPEKSIVLNKLARLYRELTELTKDKEDYNLIDFVNDLNVYEKYRISLSDNLWGSDNDNAVRLMTAHGAKGMEFEQVFIMKCQDKKWGSRSNTNKIKPPFGLLKNQIVVNETDEERRLFYVALTRAKKDLYISYSRFNHKQKEHNRSKFIQEITEHYTELITNKRDDEHEADNFVNLINSDTAANFSTLAQELIKNILSEYKMSVTDLMSYRKCPRCFYFEKILKVPYVPTRSIALGSAIHRAFKQFFETYKATRVMPNLDMLLSEFVKALRTEKLEEKDLLEAMKQGELILNNYFQAHKDNLPMNSLNELSFHSNPVTVDGVPLTGKIDRVDFLDATTGDLLVVDYKTGNPDSASGKLSINNLGDYYLQLVFYKILLENSHLLRGRVVQGKVEFLVPSKETGQFAPKEYDLTSESVAPVMELIKTTYNSIMALDFGRCNTDNFQACNHPEFHDLTWQI